MPKFMNRYFLNKKENEQMKILFLAPRLPFPADTGGKIRTSQLLKQLLKEHDIYLLTFDFDCTPEHLKMVQSWGCQVEVIKGYEMSKVHMALGAIFSSIPVSISKYWQSPMRGAIRKVIDSFKPDMIYADHVHMGVYIADFPQEQWLIDEHNVEYKILERCHEVEKGFLKRWVYASQAKRMKKMEAHLLNQAKLITCCSQDDQALIHQLCHRAHGQVLVVPNGVDLDYFKPKMSKDNNDQQVNLIFTGSMDWMPNQDAILFLGEQILPLIWSKLPQAHLYVVGKNPPPAILDLAKTDKRIIVTGRVTDVRDYIALADIVLVPLRIGGGTRLKILEALAMKKTIISTTIGAEGIPLTHQKHIWLADEPKDFASAVEKIAQDNDLGVALGENGYELIKEHFGWDAIGAHLRKQINHFIS